MNKDSIDKLNQLVGEFFDRNPKVDWIPAKEMMKPLIENGIFRKDEKNGLPLRKVLRALDKEDQLSQIPLLHAERNGTSVYWYFVQEGAVYQSSDVPAENSKRQQNILIKEQSDEYYIVDLCDEILTAKASRRHKFGFLLGDFHKDEKTRTALPVDAYYRELNLVLLFSEKQKNLSGEAYAKSDRMTISGVTRSEQRKVYDQRKRSALESKNIDYIEIDYSSFKVNGRNKLTRDVEGDTKILTAILKDHIKPEESIFE